MELWNRLRIVSNANFGINGEESSSSATRILISLGPTQPPVQWVPEALSLGVKRPDRKSDHSPPSSAEVKKSWSSASTPHTSLWRFA